MSILSTGVMIKLDASMSLRCYAKSVLQTDLRHVRLHNYVKRHIRTCDVTQ